MSAGRHFRKGRSQTLDTPFFCRLYRANCHYHNCQRHHHHCALFRLRYFLHLSKYITEITSSTSVTNSTQRFAIFSFIFWHDFTLTYSTLTTSPIADAIQRQQMTACVQRAVSSPESFFNCDHLDQHDQYHG